MGGLGKESNAVEKITISAAGYATYYNADNAVILPEGMVAQYVTSQTGNTITIGSNSLTVPSGSVVDTALDSASSNPVANSVITAALA